jgi:hypothetical protein
MQRTGPAAADAGWRLSELAQRTGATLDGDGRWITHVAALNPLVPVQSRL